MCAIAQTGLANAGILHLRFKFIEKGNTVNFPLPSWRIHQGPMQERWRHRPFAYRDALDGRHSELVEKIERNDGVSKVLAEAQIRSFEEAFAASEADR